MGPRAGLDGCGKSRPHQDSILGPSSPYLVAKPTELSHANLKWGGGAFNNNYTSAVSYSAACFGCSLVMTKHYKRVLETDLVYSTIQF